MATAGSFVLCLAFLPFRVWALALLIGLSMRVAGRRPGEDQ